MGLQAASCCPHNHLPSIIFTPSQPLLSHLTVSWRIPSRFDGLRLHSPFFLKASTSYSLRGSSLSSWTREFIIHASTSNQEDKLRSSGHENAYIDLPEPLRGKSGSMSFSGVTHQSIEESKLISAPFEEKKGSFIWVLAPVALISSLVLPQFVGNVVYSSFKKQPVFSEMIVSFISEVIFYIGLSIFLHVTDEVQKPYLQFSSKRWGLITGLKGYLSSTFFIMGLKVCGPLIAVSVSWPVLGFPALVSVAPFLASCGAQFIFERRLENRRSSSWPLVPIIFEVYRMYQLGKAATFMQKLMTSMRGVPITQTIVERSSALYGMVVTFQVLGFVCLWSLLTFLMRLFPSRPVAENY